MRWFAFFHNRTCSNDTIAKAAAYLDKGRALAFCPLIRDSLFFLDPLANLKDLKGQRMMTSGYSRDLISGEQGVHVATTCTETSIRSKALDLPSQLPEKGDAFSCERDTATVTCSEPTSLLLVGSKPSHPRPGT